MMRRSFVIAIIVVAAIMGVAIYFFYDPSSSQFFPKCFFKQITGYDCPGCGSQRAIHCLLHGDLAGVWQYNAALFVAIPVIMLYGYAELRPHKCVKLNTFLFSTPAVCSLVGALCLWWVLRNVI